VQYAKIKGGKGKMKLTNKYKSKREQGFTIIEVLIVLAIAGLIILIVFLAVPALQRNSRNTQRRNDVSALLGAAQEYVNNNSGSLPAAAADITDNVNLGFYDASTQVAYTGNNTDVPSAFPLPATKDVVTINNFSKCDGNNNYMAAGDTTTRNVTAVYYVETSSSVTPQCQDM
jgi:prepilin-type N-terminal cleavage/methylation domain-containing protein